MAIFDRFRRNKRAEEPQQVQTLEPYTAEESEPQRTIGAPEIEKAYHTLQKYKEGKANLERRIIDNEEWYKLRQWGRVNDRSTNPGDPEPASGWLLNAILNKHADAMDNYPEAHVLPREKDDTDAAKTLSSILPVVLEQNDYEQVYSDIWWYKLKTGTGVTGVFWDNTKDGGIGDIDIRRVDILNVFWEPGVTDIQDSKNLFVVEMADIEDMQQRYPDRQIGRGSSLEVAKYLYDDTVDTTYKVAVVDWYYKLDRGGKTVLHYCKFVGSEVLYSSEDDEQTRESGWYAHGQYPFVFDTLFPTEGTPCGFGYIDMMKSPQAYIDKMDQVMLKHAMMGSRPRFFVRADGSINEEEYADWTKDFIHYSGSGDPRADMLPVEIPDLSGAYLTLRQAKIDELKETSGNRDFAQGGTTSGVTAASAIAALQEAGNKLSRDNIKSAYRAFRRVCYLVIELMRQFYDTPRYFRITGEQGQTEFVEFDNAAIAPQQQGMDFGMDMGVKQPIFDVRVTTQRSNPFNTITENERAKELYQMGFFRPDLTDQALAALEMMRFDGIEDVKERIARNGTMAQKIQDLQHQMMQMATIIDTMRGTSDLTASMAQEFAGAQQAAQGGRAQENNRGVTTDGLGRETGRNTIAERARQRAAEGSNPT